MTIIIPAYNPDEHLISVLDDIKKKLNLNVIVVDDGSVDKKIFDRVKQYKNVTLLTHDINKGKGKAMKTAMEYVYKNIDDDGIVFVDADGQHKIEDVKKIIDCFDKNKNDLIIGVRKFKGKVPLKSRLGNNITKFLFSVFTLKKISDTQTGLRAINTKYIPFLLKIEGNRYEYEMNMLLSVVGNRINIIEIPIETVYEDMQNSTSHFRAFRDSFLVYKTFLKFIGSGLLSFLVDYIAFILFIKLFNNNVPLIVFMCNIFARLISGTVNYNLNKHFVFRSSKERTLKDYIILSVIIILINSFILNLFINTFKINAYLSKFVVETILFVLNFIIEKNIVFSCKWRKI